MPSNVLNLCTVEAREFFHLAQTLQTALEASEQNGLIKALEDYFRFLRDDRICRKPAIGIQAEVNAVLRHFFPIVTGAAAPAPHPAGVAVEPEATDAPAQALSDRAVRADKDPSGAYQALIKDLSALFVKLYMVDSESDPMVYHAYYDEWSRRQSQQDLADRVKRHVDFVIRGAEKLEDKFAAKAVILGIMGDILVELQYKDQALAYIEKDMDRRRQVTPLGLLCYEILRRFDFEETDQPSLLYWSANDEFARYLFSSWGWLKPVDFYTPLTADERQDMEKIGRDDDLYRKWKNVNNPNGRGRDGAYGVFPLARWESAIHSEPEDGHVDFEPVPILLIGLKEVGKSTYLWALTDELQRYNSPRHINISSNALQEYYSRHRDSWLQGDCSTTLKCESYQVKLGLEGALPGVSDLRVLMTDTIGGDVNPNEGLPDTLKTLISKARGILFFLDSRDFRPDRLDSEDPSDFQDLTMITNWYARILNHFCATNLGTVHIPIGVVINKADLIMGDDVLKLRRQQLIDDNVERLLFHLPLNRVKADGRPTDPLSLLRQCMMEDLENNRTLKSQRMIRILFNHAGNFLHKILATTYRFQIFTTVSLSPMANKAFPVGVLESFNWMVEELYRSFTYQAVPIIENHISELKKIKSEIERQQKKHRTVTGRIENVSQGIQNESIDWLSWMRSNRGYEKRFDVLKNQQAGVAHKIRTLAQKAAQYLPYDVDAHCVGDPELKAYVEKMDVGLDWLEQRLHSYRTAVTNLTGGKTR